MHCLGNDYLYVYGEVPENVDRRGVVHLYKRYPKPEGSARPVP